MPPLPERLTKKDFSLFAKKKLIRSDLLDIAYIEAPKHKVACVIAKKHIKKAVARNKLRRKFYHAYIAVRPEKPYMVVLYPKPQAQYVSYGTLLDTLQKLLTPLS
jgi:ribonuclease P protein component